MDAPLRRAYDEGRAAHGALPLSFEDYEGAVRALVGRRLAALGLEATQARVREATSRAAGADLFLAVACDRGAPGAWEAFHRGYAPRLVGLAVRRGAQGAQAESVVADLLGALASPPPRGGSRTLLGTYDGSGSLFAWLAVSLVRRVGAEGRDRRVVPLDEERAPSGAAPRAARAPDPAEAVLDEEAADRFEAAFRAALEALTAKERLAVLLKHRDGLSQREMAPLLGVGEPRVSRIVASAVERLTGALRGHLRAAVAGRGGSEDALWAALRSAVERRMANSAVPGPLPSREGSHHAAR